MNRLKELRNSRGMKQKVLADILGTTQQNISRYEQDITTVPASVLIVISNYFDVSVDDLLGLSDVKEVARECDAPKKSSEYDSLIENIKTLSAADQKTVSDMVAFLGQRKKTV